MRAIQLAEVQGTRTNNANRDLIVYKNNLCELWETMGKLEDARMLRENILVTAGSDDG
jgi:hypothetical protein